VSILEDIIRPIIAIIIPIISILVHLGLCLCEGYDMLLYGNVLCPCPSKAVFTSNELKYLARQLTPSIALFKNKIINIISIKVINTLI